VTLTLRELRVRAVDVPMARPLQTAVGVIPSTPLALIDLVSEEGVTGTTYVFCYSRPGLAAVVATLRELGPALAGTDLAPVPLWTQLRARLRLLGTGGAIGLALNGIDMAAWDAAARAASLPLVELLGGRSGAPVTAYGSLKSMRPQDLAEEAAERVAEGGFRYLKLKIGATDIDGDLAAIAAVRDAAGEGVGLMVDYNQSLTLTEALARIRVLDDQGLSWIEEPLPAEDLDGYARLCAAVETPIQAGESWWSPEEAARCVAARASDLVMPDVARETLNGGDDLDIIFGGIRRETINGGTNAGGVDVLSYVFSTSGVTVDLQTGIGTGGFAANDTFVDIEGVTGSSFGDTLLGSSRDDILEGYGGNDTLTGRGGSDTFWYDLTRVEGSIRNIGNDTITDFEVPNGANDVVFDQVYFDGVASTQFQQIVATQVEADTVLTSDLFIGSITIRNFDADLWMQY